MRVIQSISAIALTCMLSVGLAQAKPKTSGSATAQKVSVPSTSKYQKITPAESNDCAELAYYATYGDGTTVSVASCDGFEAKCCDEPVLIAPGEDAGTGNSDECYWTCTEVCTGETQTYETEEFVENLGYSLRGFPTFYQHKVNSERSKCPDLVKSGCGPVAVTEVLAWYDQLGWTDLGDDFRTGNKLDWQSMAQTLRDDYLNTKCHKDNTLSGTNTRNLKKGLKNYLKDVGVDYSLSKYIFGQSKVDTHIGKIMDFIDQKKPVILGYCSKKNEDYGIQETWPNNKENCGSHWGVIVGYDWRGEDFYVNIVTGWGEGDNHTKKFDISTRWGYLTLVYLTLKNSDRTSTRWCAADNKSTYYTKTNDIGYWAQSSSYDDYPVVETIEGTECAIIGGDVYETTTKSYTPVSEEILETCDAEWIGPIEDGPIDHDPQESLDG